MDIELRAQLRSNLFDSLFGFASTALQKLWVTGHPDVVVSYVETMCGWFDDLLDNVGGLSGAVNSGLLSQVEADALDPE